MAKPHEIRRLTNMPAGPAKDAYAALLASRERSRDTKAKCEWCGTEFAITRPNRKFCVKKCRTDFHNFAQIYLRARYRAKYGRSLSYAEMKAFMSEELKDPKNA